MLDSTSVAEKVGILGILGGICVACVKVARFLYRFSQEHEMILKFMADTEDIPPRVIRLEETAEHVQAERRELLEEVRGLRQDVHDFLKTMLERGN